MRIRLDIELKQRLFDEVKNGLAASVDILVNEAVRNFFYVRDHGFSANGPKAPPGATTQAKLRKHYPEVMLSDQEIGRERWKEMPGYPGYKISDLGRVKSPRRILQTQCNNAGYRQAAVKRSDGKQRNITVHRMVAEVFLPNPHNKPEVNHKEGNKGDCRLCKLEWATREENNWHAEEIGLRSGRNKRRALLQ